MATERRQQSDRRALPALPEETDRLVAAAFTEEQTTALRKVWGLNARTLAEVQQIVSGQYRLLRGGLLVLFVLMIAIGVVSIRLLIDQSSTVDSVRANQQHITVLARTNRRLIAENLSLERSTRANQAANTHALCSLRADVEKRVTTGDSFLRAHPKGILGIPAPTLQASIDNSQRTVDALSSLVCPK